MRSLRPPPKVVPPRPPAHLFEPLDNPSDLSAVAPQQANPPITEPPQFESQPPPQQPKAPAEVKPGPSGFEEDVAKEMYKLEREFQQMLAADRQAAAAAGNGGAIGNEYDPSNLIGRGAGAGHSEAMGINGARDVRLPVPGGADGSGAGVRLKMMNPNIKYPSQPQHERSPPRHQAPNQSGLPPPQPIPVMNPSVNSGPGSGSPARRKGAGVAHMFETEEDIRRKQHMQSDYNNHLKEQVLQQEHQRRAEIMEHRGVNPYNQQQQQQQYDPALNGGAVGGGGNGGNASILPQGRNSDQRVRLAHQAEYSKALEQQMAEQKLQRDSELLDHRGVAAGAAGLYGQQKYPHHHQQQQHHHNNMRNQQPHQQQQGLGDTNRRRVEKKLQYSKALEEQMQEQKRQREMEQLEHRGLNKQRVVAPAGVKVLDYGGFSGMQAGQDKPVPSSALMQDLYGAPPPGPTAAAVGGAGGRGGGAGGGGMLFGLDKDSEKAMKRAKQAEYRRHLDQEAAVPGGGGGAGAAAVRRRQQQQQQGYNSNEPHHSSAYQPQLYPAGNPPYKIPAAVTGGGAGGGGTGQVPFSAVRGSQNSHPHVPVVDENVDLELAYLRRKQEEQEQQMRELARQQEELDRMEKQQLQQMQLEAAARRQQEQRQQLLQQQQQLSPSRAAAAAAMLSPSRLEMLLPTSSDPDQDLRLRQMIEQEYLQKRQQQQQQQQQLQQAPPPLRHQLAPPDMNPYSDAYGGNGGRHGPSAAAGGHGGGGGGFLPQGSSEQEEQRKKAEKRQQQEEYRRNLDRQMEEVKARKQRDKAEKDHEDLKLLQQLGDGAGAAANASNQQPQRHQQQHQQQQQQQQQAFSPQGQPSQPPHHYHAENRSPANSSPNKARARMMQDIYGNNSPQGAPYSHGGGAAGLGGGPTGSSRDDGEHAAQDWKPSAGQNDDRKKQVILGQRAALDEQLNEVRARKAREKEEQRLADEKEDQRIRAELAEIEENARREKGEMRAKAAAAAKELTDLQERKAQELLAKKARGKDSGNHPSASEHADRRNSSRGGSSSRANMREPLRVTTPPRVTPQQHAAADEHAYGHINSPLKEMLQQQQQLDQLQQIQQQQQQVQLQQLHLQQEQLQKQAQSALKLLNTASSSDSVDQFVQNYQMQQNMLLQKQQQILEQQKQALESPPRGAALQGYPSPYGMHPSPGAAGVPYGMPPAAGAGYNPYFNQQSQPLPYGMNGPQGPEQDLSFVSESRLLPANPWSSSEIMHSLVPLGAAQKQQQQQQQQQQSEPSAHVPALQARAKRDGGDLEQSLASNSMLMYLGQRTPVDPMMQQLQQQQLQQQQQQQHVKPPSRGGNGPVVNQNDHSSPQKDLSKLILDTNKLIHKEAAHTSIQKRELDQAAAPQKRAGPGAVTMLQLMEPSGADSSKNNNYNNNGGAAAAVPIDNDLGSLSGDEFGMPKNRIVKKDASKPKHRHHHRNHHHHHH